MTDISPAESNDMNVTDAELSKVTTIAGRDPTLN
ncbi:hypothetical protein Glaag_1683 [Glaciecola sp. 4H-3-7+YE-5]|nr:hypothetical protein Glaag_1683 [Glaciecola sp. 4H-3-7+YE-5]